MCSDNDSVVKCLYVNDVAWAAPGANRDGYHHELSGRASQTITDWHDPFSVAQLNIAAQWCADVLNAEGIPAVFVDHVGLLAGKSGVTTHAEVNKAYHRSTHTDPGVAFPMAEFIALVSEFKNHK